MSPCHSSVFVYCVGRHTCPSVVQVHWTAPEWDQPQPSNFCLKESNKVGGPAFLSLPPLPANLQLGGLRELTSACGTQPACNLPPASCG